MYTVNHGVKGKQSWKISWQSPFKYHSSQSLLQNWTFIGRKVKGRNKEAPFSIFLCLPYPPPPLSPWCYSIHLSFYPFSHQPVPTLMVPPPYNFPLIFPPLLLWLAEPPICFLASGQPWIEGPGTVYTVLCVHNTNRILYTSRLYTHHTLGEHIFCGGKITSTLNFLPEFPSTQLWILNWNVKFRYPGFNHHRPPPQLATASEIF